jgi:hypothetical protein
MLGVVMSWMSQIAPIQVFKFHPALHLELLDKVAMPVEP